MASTCATEEENLQPSHTTIHATVPSTHVSPQQIVQASEWPKVLLYSLTYTTWEAINRLILNSFNLGKPEPTTKSTQLAIAGGLWLCSLVTTVAASTLSSTHNINVTHVYIRSQLPLSAIFACNISQSHWLRHPRLRAKEDPLGLRCLQYAQHPSWAPWFGVTCPTCSPEGR